MENGKDPIVKRVAPRNRIRQRRGAVMLDSLIACMVLGMGAVGLYTMLPGIKQSQVRAAQEMRATQMANRFIEHIQLLKPANLTAPTLQQLSLIDPGQSSSPFTFTNIPLDDASGYSPAQALPDGRGFMTVSALGSGSQLVTVEIRWRSNAGERVYRTGTVVGGYR